MDPPERIAAAGDTTFAIMKEVGRRRHEIFFALAEDLFAQGSRISVTARKVVLSEQGVSSAAFALGDAVTMRLAECDVVLMRHDPPYNERYHLATLLLELARSDTFIVNDPRGLREANEKLYTLNFEAFMPPTLISRDRDQIRAFATSVGGDLVIKPVQGYAGRGVFHLRPDDRNGSALLEMMTGYGKEWIVAQKYLPEARQGDKRILLLGGEPIGQLLRIPSDSDVRANMAVGGRAVATTLTDHDRAICEALAPRLRQDGLHFVGIDVIGDYLTEVNVTSPTGIVAASKFAGTSVEARVVDWLEAHATG